VEEQLSTLVANGAISEQPRTVVVIVTDNIIVIIVIARASEDGSYAEEVKNAVLPRI